MVIASKSRQLNGATRQVTGKLVSRDKPWKIKGSSRDSKQVASCRQVKLIEIDQFTKQSGRYRPLCKNRLEMNLFMSKKWWRAAGIRALKTVCQTLASTLPVGFVVTPVMIQQLDWSTVYVVLAWLGTGLLSGVVSMLTSLAGLPEVDDDDDSDAGLPVY